jgi:hypothetical protein
MSDYRKLLVSPSGVTVVSTSPAETNDLIYGRGYTLDESQDDTDRDTDGDTDSDSTDATPGRATPDSNA